MFDKYKKKGVYYYFVRKALTGSRSSNSSDIQLIYANTYNFIIMKTTTTYFLQMMNRRPKLTRRPELRPSRVWVGSGYTTHNGLGGCQLQVCFDRAFQSNRK